MKASKPIYCLDASSLIFAWTEHYPPSMFPTLWEHLGRLASEGRLVSPVEVRRELEAGDDDLAKWAHLHPELFRDLTEDVQRAATTVMAMCPNLIDVAKLKDGADPFVVAVAIVEGAVVVTNETPTGNAKRDKIPDACRKLNLEYVDWLRFMEAEGYRFALVTPMQREHNGVAAPARADEEPQPQNLGSLDDTYAEDVGPGDCDCGECDYGDCTPDPDEEV
ncbi:MAG TPA: DUF4411 family protein [Polyangia bacterium]|jgi:hypothetical protein